MKLSDIIAKCSQDENKEEEDGGRESDDHTLADLVIPRLGEKDKDLLVMVVISFLYERHAPSGKWEAEVRQSIEE